MEPADIAQALYQLQDFMLALWHPCPAWSATVRGDPSGL